MAKIEIITPTDEQLRELDLENWSSWESPVKTFDWEYSDTETCYLYEGHVKVTTPEETVEFKKGDLVKFPKGLKCTWQVIEPVRKVYKFE